MKCPTCGKDNRIVNECRCDPNNLPTRVSCLHENFAASVTVNRLPEQDGGPIKN